MTGIRETAMVMASTGVDVETSPREAARAASAADSMAALKNILVAVDFSEGSRAAVERALSMATEETRVTVLHVIRRTGPGGEGSQSRAGSSAYAQWDRAIALQYARFLLAVTQVGRPSAFGLTGVNQHSAST